MAEDPPSVSAWRQIIHSMSSRHEASSAWHGCRECLRMRRRKVAALIVPPGRLQCMFWINVTLLCHFRTWLFLGYSLKLPTPSLSQPTPPKEMELAANPNWCPPLGQVTVSVHIRILNMFPATIRVIFQMVQVVLVRGKNVQWSTLVIFDIQFRG